MFSDICKMLHRGVTLYYHIEVQIMYSNMGLINLCMLYRGFLCLILQLLLVILLTEAALPKSCQIDHITIEK